MDVQTIRDLTDKDFGCTGGGSFGCDRVEITVGGHTFWITESRDITQRGLRIGSASGYLPTLCITPIAGNIIEAANLSESE